MFWYDGSRIDGSQLQLDINEPGLCYGATSFTTMRVYDRSLSHPLTQWQQHCDRLKISLGAFGWQQPNWKLLKQGAQTLLEHFPVLRITVFPNGKEWITGRSLPADLKQRQTLGITAWLAADTLYRRDLPAYKTGNYLSAYLARDRALKLNAKEAILIDADGNWLETSTGNLWGWKDNCWYTPDLNSGILPGIARSRWLDFFRDRDLKVVENTWTPQFVLTIKALAYSNCVVDFVPITTLLTTGNKIDYSLERP